mgnify:CR=1 FL=1
MKLFHIFSSTLLTDGLLINWRNSHGLIDNIVRNFPQQIFDRDAVKIAITDALVENQELIEGAISDGINLERAQEHFASLTAEEQAEQTIRAFKTVFGDSALAEMILKNPEKHSDLR